MHQTLVNKGHLVHVLCNSYLENGRSIDEEDENQPIWIKAGSFSKSNPFANSIAQALVGMRIHDTKSVRIPAAQAFGLKDPDKVLEVPLRYLSSDVSVDDEVQVNILNDGKKELADGVVVNIAGGNAYVDLNHPYAGNNLVVKIKILSLK